METGWSYLFIGKCAEARTHFQKALELLAAAPDAAIAEQVQKGIDACRGK